MNINYKTKLLSKKIFLPKKIILIGTSGSGKTTFGNNLSKILKIPCTDLDDLFWLPNWQKRR